MKLLAIAASTILVLGLTTTAYAQGQADRELEHALKTPTNVESPAGDMSKMKAAGKCGAGQHSTGRTFNKSVKSTSAEALEHANKTPSGADSYQEDMSAMKAAGKCGAGQSASHKTKTYASRAQSESEQALEHANKTPSGADSYREDMSKMKAAGKCGSN